MEIKAKINKWDLIKLKSFCAMKETISKVKRQPSEWEKIIASETTDKELISKISKQVMQLNSRKINAPIKAWAKELSRHFSNEDIQVANKHEKMLNITLYSVQFSSVQFSHSVVSDSLRPHDSQCTRPPCPSRSPGVHSNSCPSNPWCHPAISSSVVLFSSCPQTLPVSESFPRSQLFARGGQVLEFQL